MKGWKGSVQGSFGGSVQGFWGFTASMGSANLPTRQPSELEQGFSFYSHGALNFDVWAKRVGVKN